MYRKRRWPARANTPNPAGNDVFWDSCGHSDPVLVCPTEMLRQPVFQIVITCCQPVSYNAGSRVSVRQPAAPRAPSVAAQAPGRELIVRCPETPLADQPPLRQTCRSVYAGKPSGDGGSIDHIIRSAKPIDRASDWSSVSVAASATVTRTTATVANKGRSGAVDDAHHNTGRLGEKGKSVNNQATAITRSPGTS